MRLFSARWLLTAPDSLLARGAVLVSRGRVRAVFATLAEAERRAPRAKSVDLGPGVLTPGLVNAHAHLDLSALADRVPTSGSDAGFRSWIDALIARRRECSPEDIEAGARRGADRLLATGTTYVGDIDTTGVGRRVLRSHALRGRSYREVLDAADEQRSARAMRRVRFPLPPWRHEGLSPHAPYTVSGELFRRVAELAAKRNLPVTIHWAETRAEGEWMLEGRGPFEGLLRNSPCRSGLQLIEAAGLLGPRTSLVHANHPAPGERERVARSGAALVHCPGSHLFFGREPFDWSAWRAAGVPIALGTDSWASNADLDMRREMSLLRAAHPDVSPQDAWRAATTAGARAVGLEGRIGAMVPGARADLTLFRSTASGPSECWEELTSGSPEVAGVWIRGRRRLHRNESPPCP